MMFSYPLIVDHGHLLLQLNQKIYLIDTGATISILPEEILPIAGKTYKNFPQDQLVTIEKLNSFLNRKIDGLIGADILVNFIVTLNMAQGTVEFEDDDRKMPENNAAPFELFQGVPVIDVSIEESRGLKAFLDTGAQLSYLDVSITKGKQKEGHRKDFHPSLGEFETDIFCMETQVCDKTLKVFFGNLPEILKNSLMKKNIKGIIGFDLFMAYSVCINYKNRQISLIS